MAVRARYTIEAAVSSDTTEARDIGNIRYTVLNDQYGEGATMVSTLAVSSTNTSVPFPNIASAKLLIVKTTAKDPTKTLPAVTLRLNSIAGEEISIAPLSGGKEGHFVISSSGITGIWMTNPSATVIVNCTITVIGD